jgi:lipopolysaccharide/colanic/teichoic acid biosynthesis glycosyltransferase
MIRLSQDPAENQQTMSTLAFKEEKSEARRRSFTLAVYRCLDLFIAVVGVLVCAPLCMVACLAIRLDSGGPAIFRQRRLGRDKQPFTVHKFRTMRLEADPRVHREYVEQLIKGAETTHAGDDGRDLYKLAADDRVTRVGCFLRKTSLDELPQLYDVLQGHMSLVGPRPIIPYEAELYPPSYNRRFAVKPGMTGLWQINGRNERTYREMVELDVAWVERHSVALYLSILARTPWVLLRRRGVA